jgi:hypothetical protein
MSQSHAPDRARKYKEEPVPVAAHRMVSFLLFCSLPCPVLLCPSLSLAVVRARAAPGTTARSRHEASVAPSTVAARAHSQSQSLRQRQSPEAKPACHCRQSLARSSSLCCMLLQPLQAAPTSQLPQPESLHGMRPPSSPAPPNHHFPALPCRTHRLLLASCHPQARRRNPASSIPEPKAPSAVLSTGLRVALPSLARPPRPINYSLPSSLSAPCPSHCSFPAIPLLLVLLFPIRVLFLFFSLLRCSHCCCCCSPHIADLGAPPSITPTRRRACHRQPTIRNTIRGLGRFSITNSTTNNTTNNIIPTRLTSRRLPSPRRKLTIHHPIRPIPRRNLINHPTSSKSQDRQDRSNRKSLTTLPTRVLIALTVHRATTHPQVRPMHTEKSKHAW